MLNIDRLKYYWDQPFLDLMAGMERKIRHNDPDIVFWYKDKTYYFKEVRTIGELWCDHFNVWMFFYENYSTNSFEIQLIIKELMDRHYKLNLIPKCHNF